MHSISGKFSARQIAVGHSRTQLAGVHEDKVGKAAYNPVAKDLLGSRPTLEQVEKMIAEPLKPRETKKIDYAAMSGKNFRMPAPTSTREQTKK
jgi:hypothetical protein